jgi:hypothetical protein
VLLAYTLAQASEPERHQATRQLIERLRTHQLLAITSFYALHELFLFALEQAPNRRNRKFFWKGSFNRGSFAAGSGASLAFQI